MCFHRSLWKLALIACSVWLLPLSSWAQKDPNCGPPNVLLVVDTSGSMSQAGKIEALRTTIEAVVVQFKGQLRFGLISFSGSIASVKVPIGPDDDSKTDAHIQLIVDAARQFQAEGATPMTAAMREARKHYQEALPKDALHKLPDPATKRRNYVVLMTDGEPTDGDPMPEIKALRTLQVGAKTYDILTFVIGLGSGQDIRAFQLDEFAKAGGTNNFLQSSAAGDLISTFQTALTNATNKEVCNGRDDDCDGVIDEDLERECQSACGVGKEVCKNGQWSQCNAEPPGPEICDGRDNDCDGKVDEALSRTCTTACGSGNQACIRGDWSTCNAPQPEPEICDGKDNDCDGKIDNGSLCPGGNCLNETGLTRCRIQCKDGECPSGFFCEAATQECRERPCRLKKDCAPGDICDDSSGTAICKNVCQDLTCPSGQTCGLSGTCVDCYKEPCPPKMACFQGRCIVDKCADASCDKKQGCFDGLCFDTCDGVTCPQGKRCTKGRCEGDPCAGIQCPTANQLCIEGKCFENKCSDAKAKCAAQQICNPKTGICEDDPCLRTRCPSGVSCYNGQCGVDPPAGFCKTEANCDQSKVCKAGACVFLACAGDTDCLAKSGTTCIDRLCRGAGVAPEGCHCATPFKQGDLSFPFALLLFLSAFLLRRSRA